MRAQFLIRLFLLTVLIYTWTPVSAKITVRKNKIYPISSGEMVQHNYYSLAYSEEYEGALWVFYHLTPAHVNGEAIRKDNFRDDPLVSTGSATWNDYKGSGYDKGHLCPAASMSINQQAIDESFYMSTMSPQDPNFNRGCWKNLESKVRDWVLSMNALYVVSGPIYNNIEEYIGENKVAVPKYYYKVIWDGKDKMIGFIMPNEKCQYELSTYIVPVDSIESVTNINFFSKIPNRIEKVIEAEVNSEPWGF
ncbi:MAG: DNA/RNA non-specific endonuclease [Prolixibacteraceae bacterium]